MFSILVKPYYVFQNFIVNQGNSCNKINVLRSGRGKTLILEKAVTQPTLKKEEWQTYFKKKNI